MPLCVLAGLVCSFSLPRRSIVAGGAAALAATPLRRGAAVEAPPGFEAVQPSPAVQAPLPGFEYAQPSRVQGIGGGADMLESTPTIADVAYPPSLNGSWVCTRRVTSVEGDALQAEGAWRLLGGDGNIRKEEVYEVRYIEQPAGGALAITGIDGNRYYGVVLDRGREMDARTRGSAVAWDVSQPDLLRYERALGGRGSAAELKVVQRSVELPSDKGWGSNELLRITTTAGAAFASFDILYAARVQRRFRRANDQTTGERVVEGLEVVKTYRVLDGVAGVEMPTSTTKSILRLMRLRAAE